MYHGGAAGDVETLEPAWGKPNLLGTAGVFTTNSPRPAVGYAMGSGFGDNYQWIDDDAKSAFAEQLMQADIQDIVERTEDMVHAIPADAKIGGYELRDIGDDGGIGLRSFFKDRSEELVDRIHRFQETGDLSHIPSPDELANWGIEIEPLMKSVKLGDVQEGASRYTGFVKMKKPLDVDRPMDTVSMGKIRSKWAEMQKDAFDRGGRFGRDEGGLASEGDDVWVPGAIEQQWDDYFSKIENPTGWDVLNFFSGADKEDAFSYGSIIGSPVWEERNVGFHNWLKKQGVNKDMDNWYKKKYKMSDEEAAQMFLDMRLGDDLDEFYTDYSGAEDFLEDLALQSRVALKTALSRGVDLKAAGSALRKSRSGVGHKDIPAHEKDALMDIQTILFERAHEMAFDYSDSYFQVLAEGITNVGSKVDYRNMPDEAIFGTEGIIREILEKSGFDGLTHVGGITDAGAPHRVAVAFRGSQVGDAPKQTDNLAGLKVFMGLGAGGAVAATGRQEQ
jgi:hypothetical protein